MIGYVDTSSLVKLYVEEEGSRRVRDFVERSELVATSVVAYPEARAALARQCAREGSRPPGTSEPGEISSGTGRCI